MNTITPRKFGIAFVILLVLYITFLDYTITLTFGVIITGIYLTVCIIKNNWLTVKEFITYFLEDKS